MRKILLLILPFVFVACECDDINRSLAEKADVLLDEVLKESFNGLIDVRKDSNTYEHLQKLTEEAFRELDAFRFL